MRMDDWVHVVVLLQFLKYVNHTTKKCDSRAKSTLVIQITQMQLIVRTFQCGVKDSVCCWTYRQQSPDDRSSNISFSSISTIFLFRTYHKQITSTKHVSCCRIDIHLLHNLCYFHKTFSSLVHAVSKLVMSAAAVIVFSGILLTLGIMTLDRKLCVIEWTNYIQEHTFQTFEQHWNRLPTTW